MKCIARVIGCLAGAAAAPLAGQTADEQAVIEVVQELFDAMTVGDTARMGAVWEDGARLVQTFTTEGRPAMRLVSRADFLGTIAGRDGPPLREVFVNPRVAIRDNLASIWIDYTFYVGDQLSHCGEDNFQMARTAAGWKIVALADTQRRMDCPDRR